jgi:D-alanyl-D-alanine carboxypeptidase
MCDATMPHKVLPLVSKLFSNKNKIFLVLLSPKNQQSNQRMIKQFVSTLLLLNITICSFEQTLPLAKRIDSLLSQPTTKPFNGIIYITQNAKLKYAKVSGYANLPNKTPLQLTDEFVVGSISKQFTAVLVLQEFDKGRLDLFVPIRKHLPELAQSWADTVTVHHLLTHMHGINELNEPTRFKVGSQYAYSQIGFELLAKIVERISGKSFAEMSKALFAKCGMKSSFHPNTKGYTRLVSGYTEQENGNLLFDSASLKNYAAAGAFISTAKDLLLWNQLLHNGKLLKPSTFKMMMTKQTGAVRQHPLFGVTEYGYGTTIDTKENILQIGQTGYAPGFVSMNFYYPATKTSLIILENIAYDPQDLKKAFYFHMAIRKMLRESF